MQMCKYLYMNLKFNRYIHDRGKNGGEEACRNTSIEPSIMKVAVAEYMKAAMPTGMPHEYQNNMQTSKKHERNGDILYFNSAFLLFHQTPGSAYLVGSYWVHCLVWCQ